MKKEPLFVALSNQKGGVGKSTFTVLLASYFHYLKGYNVLVVDCDYPQHSISTMRDWEVGTIEKNVHLQNQLVEQFGTSGRGLTLKTDSVNCRHHNLQVDVNTASTLYQLRECYF